MDAPIELPHHQQQTDHTCGPAAIKMVLDALGHSLPERTLERVMDTDPSIGTRQRIMARFADELGLAVRVRHSDTDVAEIRDAMAKGEVVIVCYWLSHEDTDHYAVVSGIRPGAIILHDPWEGPEYVVAIEEFDRNWIGDDRVPGRMHRWMMAIQVV